MKPSRSSISIDVERISAKTSSLALFGEKTGRSGYKPDPTNDLPSIIE
jgi:hypothetical protein